MPAQEHTDAAQTAKPLPNPVFRASTPANSPVSPALKFWHDAEVDKLQTGLQRAKELLEKSGYKVVGNRLHYPAGVKEALTAVE